MASSGVLGTLFRHCLHPKFSSQLNIFIRQLLYEPSVQWCVHPEKHNIPRNDHRLGCEPPIRLAHWESTAAPQEAPRAHDADGQAPSTSLELPTETEMHTAFTTNAYLAINFLFLRTIGEMIRTMLPVWCFEQEAGGKPRKAPQSPLRLQVGSL